jgi:hypothetical protein
MKLTKTLILGFVLLTTLFSGCATLTKQPTNIFPDPKPDKGLVYFYRESHFMGSAISYNIREKDQVIGAIANGTYFFVFADPGVHTYTASTEADSSRTLTIQGGKTYYVECGVEMGVFAGRPTLRIANEDEGKSVLRTVTYALK